MLTQDAIDFLEAIEDADVRFMKDVAGNAVYHLIQVSEYLTLINKARLDRDAAQCRFWVLCLRRIMQRSKDAGVRHYLGIYNHNVADLVSLIEGADAQVEAKIAEVKANPASFIKGDDEPRGKAPKGKTRYKAVMATKDFYRHSAREYHFAWCRIDVHTSGRVGVSSGFSGSQQSAEKNLNGATYWILSKAIAQK